MNRPPFTVVKEFLTKPRGKAAASDDIEKKKGGKNAALEKRPMMLRFPIQEQILFTKRLAMILRSGMPIMEGLHILSSETRSRSATHIYETLVGDVSRGQPLSLGMSKFGSIFGDFSVNIIRVGEASGTLHENLEYLSEELKRKQSLKRKVVGALIYPAVIVFATFGITIMLTVFIFPKIVPIFASVKATLPLSTRMLMSISTFLKNDGFLFFGILAALAVGFAFLLRIERVRYYTDRFILKIPVLGKLSQCYNLANICRTMALLLRSDVRIVEAIDLVAASTKNLVFRGELLEARERIIHGQNISSQFKARTHIFPTLMAQMVHVGEKTGNLSGTFMYLSGMYEEEIDDLTKNLTTMLEPILMIVMGVVVGFIAISIISPIYSITQNLTPR